VTIPAEHLADPHARLGLLEALPDVRCRGKAWRWCSSRAWCFFICQIAQLSGQEWFYVAFYRAAYLLALPVLLVWLLTRRFSGVGIDAARGCWV